MERVVFGLGSSLGDRMESLVHAEAEIRNLDQVFFHSKSSVYESAPWGGKANRPFLNNILCVETTLSPETLLHQCLEIESRLGRTRTRQWEDRCIDIDILLFGDRIIHSDDLILPHSHMLQRKFVLVPLFEIEPNLIIPGQKQSLETLIASCSDQSDIMKVNADSFLEEVH